MKPTSVPEPIADRESQVDPFPWFREMRRTDSVQYDSVRETWDAFGYEEVEVVLRETDRFSANTRSSAGSGDLLSETMMFSDPPQHDILRKAASEFFRSGNIGDYGHKIRAVAADLIDNALDGGELDIMIDLSFPLAVLTITEILGVPGSDRKRILSWSWEALRAKSSRDGDFDKSVEAANENFARLSRYMSNLIEKRKDTPDDGLVTHLNEVKLSEGPLTHRQKVGICMNMLIAGSVPCYLVSNTIVSFSQGDRVFERAAADSNVLDEAVKEAIRHRSPTQAQARVVTEDTCLGGKQLEEGDFVVAWISSANRDSKLFENPESFIIDRGTTNHLAFGSGIHTCLGAQLARIETRVALSELLDQVESIQVRLDEADPVRIPAFVLGFDSLPISFEAASRRGREK